MRKLVTWGGATVIGAVGAATAILLSPRSKKKGRAAVAKGKTMVRRERAHVRAMVGGGREAKPASRKASPAKNGDESLAEAIRGVIRSHGDPVQGVGVRVSRGRVTLRGEVPEIELIGSVAKTVGRLDGVREINKLLRLEARR